MNRSLRPFVLASVVVIGLKAQSTGQDATSITAETLQRIDALFAPWDSTSSPGCALGVSTNGTVVYAHGYGMANLEHDIPIRPDSIFHIGSVSKEFTAFAVALLASDGGLSLDDDVRQYLPEVPDYGRRITIRHLLTHTSGLRDAWDLIDLAAAVSVTRDEDVLNMVTRQKAPDFEPGAEYFYNNAGYVLLATIVKRISGQSFPVFTKARIFEPLGMHDSRVLDDHSMLVPRRTSAYRPRPGGGWRISVPVVDAVGPDGVATTVGDLLKFQGNLVTPRVGTLNLVSEMQTLGRLNDGLTVGYGFGVEIGTHRGMRTFGHGGTAAGYIANAVLFPDQRLAIAVLCNLRTINPRVLARSVADIVLGLTVLPQSAPAPSVSTAEIETAGLTGTYLSPMGGVVRIGVEDGQPTMNGGRLVALGDRRFRVGAGPMELQFPPPKPGAPQELRIPPPILIAPFSCRSSFGNWCSAVSTRGEVLSRVSLQSYSTSDLQAYVGEYRSDELNASFTVNAPTGSQLVVVRHEYAPVPLIPLGRDAFLGDLSDGAGTLTFVRAPSGAITGFSLQGRTPRHLSFRRINIVPAVGR